MTETFYRTGQAGAILGASSHVLRRLCEAGLIEAEHTGKQWRIPAAELERLKRDGMPPLPSPEDANLPGRKNGSRAKAELLAPPSQDAADSAEDALISENKLKAKTAKVARLKLHKEATEIGDFFRERERREADEQEALRRRRREEQEEEQQRIAAEQAAQERREWRDEWIRYAQRSRPWDAPESIELNIVEQVEQVLQTLDPSRDEFVVKRLVDAAVKRAMDPWNKSKESQEVVEMVVFRASLQCSMLNEPEWRTRAQEVAGAAIERLRDGASRSEMDTAGAAAVQPIIRECQHKKRCQEIIDRVWWKLDNPTSEESDDATDAVRAALEALPVSASDRQFEQARDTALQPIKDRIAVRLDDQMRQEIVSNLNRALPWGISDKLKQAAVTELQEGMDALPHGTPRGQLDQLRDRTTERYKKAHERHQRKESLVDGGLPEIYRYLLRREDELEKSALAVEMEIREPIRKALWETLTGQETPEQVASTVRRLVREELD